MAYVSREKKAKIAAALKIALKNSGVKYSLAVRDHSSIVLNIKSGNIDFIGNYNSCTRKKEHQENVFLNYAKDHIQVNTYHYDKHFTGKARTFLEKAMKCLNDGNHDNSDIQSDYFDVGWWVECNIGKWDKPYIYSNN